MLNVVNPILGSDQVYKSNDSGDSINIVLCDSIHEVDEQELKALLPDENMFLKPDYLRALEESNKDSFICWYALFYKNNNLAGFALYQILQIKGKDNFNIQENAKDSGGNESDKDEVENECNIRLLGRKIRNFVIQQIDKVSLGVLLNGNVFITGEHGFYFDARLIDKKSQFKLIENAGRIIQQNEKENGTDASLFLIKDFPENTLEDARLLVNKFGFQEIVAQPCMIMKVWEKWETFEDYQSSMLSKYRTRVKKCA